MKRIFCAVLILLTISIVSVAQERTSTGFIYPTGSSQYAFDTCDTSHKTGGWWMGGDGRSHPGCYRPTGVYHIGMDIKADYGSPVYAIADGQVIYISSNGWDPGDYNVGNVAVLVKHKTSQGNYFVALYGHLEKESLTVKQYDSVSAGKVIGQIGFFAWDEHIHFAIRPGTSLPQSGNGYGFGKMSNDLWPITNGFVDPISFILGNSPASNNPGRDAMLADIRKIIRTDPSWGGPNESSYGEDLNWSQDYELRWVDAVFWSRAVRIYHATDKRNRASRYYEYWNPFTSQWDGWYYCGS